MTPPRLARSLLKLCAGKEERRFIDEDLLEEYERLTAAGGLRRARRWYRRQVVGSMAPLLLDRVRRSRRSRRCEPHWRNDAGHAWRWLVRNASLTVTMTATLTVGFATTLAAWLLLYSVVLRPLPFPAPDRLVTVVPAGPNLPASVRSISLPDLDDWEESGALSVAGYSSLTFTLTGAGEPRRIEGLRVGRQFAQVLGVSPVLGRDFSEQDYVTGGHRVALIGQPLWKRAFGGAPDVLGRTLTLDGHAHEIVGILPELPFADVTAPHELWVPLIARPGVAWEPVRGNGFVSVLGRLGPTATLQGAQDELSRVAASLAEQYPRSNRDKPAVRLQSLHEAVVGEVRRPLLLICAAVLAVLLVACGNLINLLLANAERRRHEFAVRLALGAEARSIRSQVLLEVAAAAVLALVVSLMLAPALADAFLRLYPTPVPSADGIHLSLPALALAAGLCAAVVLVLAWPQIRVIGTPRIPASGARVTSSRQERRTRAALLAFQVAFTIVLAFGGVAFVRTLAKLSAIPPGFDPDGVVAFSVSPSARFGSAGATRTFFEQLLTEVRALPGVRAAAASTAVPFVNQGWGFGITPPEGGKPVIVRVTIASPGYFETLRLPLKRGRLLTEAEHTGTHLVLLNEPAARLMPYEDPVGRTLAYSGIEWTVAGIVGAAPQVRLRTPAGPELFLPWDQAGRAPQRLIVDVEGNPSMVLPLIASRVRLLDPDAPVADIMSLEDRIRRSVAAERFRAALLGALATIGIVLAGLGVWSVTAYVVARQERENGIRSALGESGVQLVRRTLATTVRPAVFGVCAGAIACMWLAPTLQAFLFEVPPRDPATLAIASLAVLATGLLAGLIPARRALAVDPASALRAE